jgi:hypothetical protein
MVMSTQVRTSNQSRASTKIVIGFVVLIAAAYFGYNYWAGTQLNGIHFPPLTPGKVNLVGVNTSKGGYHIVVANGLAQLVQSPLGAFGPGNSDPGQADTDDSGADKKRVPLKELIQTLQGKSSSAGRFVGVLNDMNENDVPANAVPWSSADVQKAVSGNAALKDKLERDLNTHLDGTPLAEFRPSTFQNGIVIHLPVTLNVTVESGTKPVTGDLLFPFQSALMKTLEVRVKEEGIDEHKLAGFYGEVGQSYIDNPSHRQDVGKALSQIISADNVKSLTTLPQTVLDSVQILANDSLITHASYTSKDADKGKLYDMSIDLTDEGRKRLWQYSRNHVKDQLLLVVDGVAVAAPVVGTELAQRNLSISNMPDESIVEDATNKINGQAQ